MRAFALLLALSAYARAQPPVVLVTARPPLDGERLADALRTYLDGYSIDVKVGPSAEGDLRAQLEAARAAGERVRALAVLRIADAEPATVEIQLVDRLTHKSLIAEVARAGRDEDFYRSVALKVQALLRSTLSEQPAEVIAAAPTLAPLIAPTVAAPPPRPPPHRLSLEVAYSILSYPTGGLVHQGVAIDARVELGRLVELSFGTAALAPVSGQTREVTALLHSIPIAAGAGVHLRRPRLEGAIGAVAELLVQAVDANGSATAVRSPVSVAGGLGAQASGRVRIARVVWLYVRGAVLGLVGGTGRYLVSGQPILERGSLQVSVEAGVGVALF